MEEKEARRPWEIFDELWAEIERLLPPEKPHPLGVAVAGAHRNDFKMARQTLESVPIPRPDLDPLGEEECDLNHLRPTLTELAAGHR